MRTAAYGRAERGIAAADRGGIRERWLYGLRLLADESAIAPAGGLRQGVTEQLIEAGRRNGTKLSAREIQWRLQVARAYPTEGQIRNAVSSFGAWRDLISAGFPPIERDPDEPDADWRTASERRTEAARKLADAASDQPALFPFDRYEPDEATLKDLRAYAEEQAEMTERFAARDRERAAYLDRLFEAADGDESVTWATAHRAAFGDEVEDGAS